MLDALRTRQKLKAQLEEADARAPRVGDVAPDFELVGVDGQATVRLSSYHGQKPVALIFGSYT